MERLKIARIATVPMAFVHFIRPLKYLEEKGHQLKLISDQGDYLQVIKKELKSPHYVIEIPREISLLRDFKALFKLYNNFRKEKYDIVHSTTPKAGLLTSIAAFLARVPVRLHTFTGQRWVSTHGILRTILRLADKLICTLNTRVYADSRSQADFLISEGIVKKDGIFVIHKGSLGGINLDRFNSSLYEYKYKEIRNTLKLDPDSLKLIYVGRVNKDKGIVELISAFLDLEENIDLILVGPFEPELDPLPEHIVTAIKTNPRIHSVGFYANPEHYLGISDVFCIPSYREGFGTVVLEAAAMGVPAIGTRIYGLTDSIVDGETGILVPVRDTESLKQAILKFYDDKNLVKKMGVNARERAKRDFHFQVLAKKLLEEYEGLRNRT